MSERKRDEPSDDDFRSSWGPMDEEIMNSRQRPRFSADEFDEMELEVNSQASWVRFVDEFNGGNMDAEWERVSLAHQATIDFVRGADATIDAILEVTH